MFFKSGGVNKATLQGHKTIKIGGSRYVIRKVNPFLDLPSDKFPQIFTSFVSHRKQKSDPQFTPEQAKGINEGIKAIVFAGLVDPPLVPVGTGDKHGREDGITVEDMFRDPTVGIKLYCAIVEHSFNIFRGLKGVFFSIRTRRLLSTALQKNMENLQLKFYSRMVDIR